MDVTMSGEASAPLPIRQPNTGPYKKQAFPMISKRPEHLRMNLWQSNAFNEFKAKKVGRRFVSILQGQIRRLKMIVLKSQCHYIEHFGQRKNKRGFLKINQWCKKKKKQNSIAELLGTSINWFLATSSQPYQGFSCWWLKTDSIKGRMLLLNHCRVLIVSKKGYPFVRQSMKLPVILATKDKLACKLGQTFSSNMESKTKRNLSIDVLRANNLNLFFI